MPVSPIGSSLVRSGAAGADVKQLQRALKAQGFDPGAVDGQFGAGTRRAVMDFQRARGLSADGVVGPKTRAALEGAAPTPASPAPWGAPAAPSTDGFEPPQGQRFPARGTGYYPDSSLMEGGFVDRKGAPLHTLQDVLAGKAAYVSVAMDTRAFAYGTKLRIPELEKKYGRPIEFRVVDTGGAFKGKGTGRIDICTANRRASLDPTINGPLTLVRQR